VAAVGTDRVLIGAWQDDTGANNAGAAYLFSTSGALLITFTNPTPTSDDVFGVSLAAVGTDRVLIGAYQDDTGANNAGAAYLFSTNGALLTTITNPTPAVGDFFGFSVTVVRTDRVLIGAYQDDVGGVDDGAAYLFSTNGTLLTTFTNPTPAAYGYFGSSVAAAGTDQVLVGAEWKGSGSTDAGAAYLFSTNGTLLTTFTNPTPAASDRFGHSVAAVGTDWALIGTPWDDTGAANAGAAYLFSLEPLTPPAPLLSTSLNPQLSTITISWPAPAEGWLLEGTNALPSMAASSWPPVPPPYQTNAGTISVTFTNLPATGSQFFRLRQP
jgi:hypothetical protein